VLLKIVFCFFKQQVVFSSLPMSLVNLQFWSFLYFPSCFLSVDPMGDEYSGSGGKCVYCVVLFLTCFLWVSF